MVRFALGLLVVLAGVAGFVACVSSPLPVGQPADSSADVVDAVPSKDVRTMQACSYDSQCQPWEMCDGDLWNPGLCVTRPCGPGFPSCPYGAYCLGYECIEDECPDNPSLFLEDVCGCEDVIHSDSDGIPDCNDDCPSDPSKSIDYDNDEDGIPNCVDPCPEDPYVGPTICGCPSGPATGVRLCLMCGYMYDPSVGDPIGNVPPGTSWENVPSSWQCPNCGIEKDFFEDPCSE